MKGSQERIDWLRDANPVRHGRGNVDVMAVGDPLPCLRDRGPPRKEKTRGPFPEPASPRRSQDTPFPSGKAPFGSRKRPTTASCASTTRPPSAMERRRTGCWDSRASSPTPRARRRRRRTNPRPSAPTCCSGGNGRIRGGPAPPSKNGINGDDRGGRRTGFPRQRARIRSRLTNARFADPPPPWRAHLHRRAFQYAARW